jgi:pimeloyl-ACP methyl ester carboxylesterase
MSLSSPICPDNFMASAITRHYLTIGSGATARRVHFRRAGTGPLLLLVHQSPRSGGEYEELMRQWGDHFTCIAPDTPGFGQSQSLPLTAPDINDYADALVEFLDALGVERIPAYGFHSGAIILITALKRHPARFTGIAAGGYGVWTEAEKLAFGSNYTPPFLPQTYGEHLIWGWNRILEQSWFFPWYDPRPETRLPNAHDDPARTHEVVLEILDAGDSFRLGYAAVLQAPRDIPPPDAVTAPVLITAYDGDPMQAHIDRLGALPQSWAARKVRTPADQHAESLAFLQGLPETAAEPNADSHQGFLPVRSAGFDGLIHWRRASADPQPVLQLHGPGQALDCLDLTGTAIDLPGHGLSSGWNGAPPGDWPAWQAVIDACATSLGLSEIALPQALSGDPARLFPDLTPDRFGSYLTTAWAIVRARHFFAPWYQAQAANALSFDPAVLAPERLAIEHRALIRASAARELAVALASR